MKKILAMATVLVATVAMASAQITLGVKGTLSVAGNTWAGDVIDSNIKAWGSGYPSGDYSDDRPSAIVGGGGSAFLRYDIINMQLTDSMALTFGVQPEIGFNANYGAMEVRTDKGNNNPDDKGKTQEISISYNTIDVPLMLVVGLDFAKFNVNVGVGPNFGFVAGDGTYIENYSVGGNNGNGLQKIHLKPFVMGIQAGLGFGYKLTDSDGLFLDARLLADFMDTTANDTFGAVRQQPQDADKSIEQSVTRRLAGLFSIGYSHKF